MNGFMNNTYSAKLDTKKYAIGIFLDLAKAFNTVDHKILLTKLKFYGIRGTTLQWFLNYLTSRSQQVYCNGVTVALSSFKHINSGVPQGSNLGPLLFLLYINDLPKATKALKLVLFADNTNAFYSHESLSVLKEIINSDLELLEEWFRTNRSSLNTKKSCYIIFSSLKKRRDGQNANYVMLDGSCMNQVTTTKFLGIYIDHYLTWVDHLKIISNKVTKNIGIMRKIAHFLLSKILTSLYYTFIYPYLTYGNIIWASNYETRIKTLVTVQKKAIRTIKGFKHYEHTQPLSSTWK